MKQTTGDVYFYDSFPFKKANISVSLIDMYAKKVIYRYTFVNAFPVKMDPPTISNSGAELVVRNVEFLFNRLEVEKIASIWY